MATEVMMPQLGLTMTEGQIMEWKKREGDTVSKGEVLFDVENDKATIDVEAQLDGVLAKIVVAENVKVPVGAVVGYIAAPGETFDAAISSPATPSSASSAAQAGTNPAARVAASPEESGAKAAPGDGFTLASPLARKKAESLGIELATIRGSGPEGAVIGRDLPLSGAGIAAERQVSGSQSALKAAPPPVAAPNDAFTDISQSRIARIAAERMAESWATIPQFTLYDEAEADQILRLAERYKKSGESVSLTAILAKLLAHAALSYPLVNASWLGVGKVRTFQSVNINIAMDTLEGLVVPVLRDCSRRGFKALGADIKLLAEKAKSGTLSPDDYAGGTITLSNLGMFGIKRFRAIVNPPQTAILAIGALSDKVVSAERGFESRKYLEYSLTADHRAVDGAYAARFMASLKSLIENPLMTMD